VKYLQLLCLAGVLASASKAETADPIGPGNLVAVLATVSDSNPALSTTPTLYGVTLNLDLPTLAPNTYYWIGVCDSTDSPCSYAETTPSAKWYFDEDGLGTGVAGNYFDMDGYPEESDTNGPFQMLVAVSGSTVFNNTTDTTGYTNSSDCFDYTCYTPVGQTFGPLDDSFYSGAGGAITNLQLILSATPDSGSFQVGLYADAPEPASFLLIAAGLGVLALLRCRAFLSF
jgi:hypothetical protein